jgi:hypothetical protein
MSKKPEDNELLKIFSFKTEFVNEDETEKKKNEKKKKPVSQFSIRKFLKFTISDIGSTDSEGKEEEEIEDIINDTKNESKVSKNSEEKIDTEKTDNLIKNFNNININEKDRNISLPNFIGEENSVKEILNNRSQSYVIKIKESTKKEGQTKRVVLKN